MISPYHSLSEALSMRGSFSFPLLSLEIPVGSGGVSLALGASWISWVVGFSLEAAASLEEDA